MRDGEETHLSSKSTVHLQPGDVISYRTSGGGGFENPCFATLNSSMSDVVDGKVSVERAYSVYGVVIDEDGQSVDLAATQKTTRCRRDRRMNNARYRLGVDIGGTFTDGVLIDTSSGEVTNSKVLSTPGDPSLGFMSAIEQLVARDGIDIAQLNTSSMRPRWRRMQSSRATRPVQRS